MPTKLLAIALNTFLESVRQPIYFVLLLSGLILQIFNVLLSAYSMGYSSSSEVSADDKLLLDMGLATVFSISTLLAALISTSIMSREIENKTVLTVISKPVGRPLFVIGKYLGSTVALLLATVIQLIFLQFALRHEVLSTASDHVDQVVVTFLGLSLLLGIGVGAWGNYFYGWVFTSTAVYVLTGALMLALPLSFMLDEDWHVQAMSGDFKPQIALASVTLLMAIPVLSAIALAASTRLTQVMTISVCVGLFLLGLLSNYFFGQYVYSNSPIATIALVEIIQDRDGDFRDGGDILRIKLDGPPTIDLQPGQIIYYGASPDGLALEVPPQRPFVGDPLDPNDYNRPDTPPNVIIQEVEPVVDDFYYIKILNAGNMQTIRPPQEGEFLFATTTSVYWPARIAWSIVPNLQFFWLVDAITQTHEIPLRYVLLTAGYSGVQVIGFVSLAVLLFQRRDVG